MANLGTGADTANSRMGELIAFPDREALNAKASCDRYRRAEAELEDCVAVLDATVARLERSLASVQGVLDTLPPTEGRRSLERHRSRMASQICAVRRMLAEI